MGEIGTNGLFPLGAACDRCGSEEYGEEGINPLSSMLAESRMAVRETGDVFDVDREFLCLECVTAEDKAAGYRIA